MPAPPHTYVHTGTGVSVALILILKQISRLYGLLLLLPNGAGKAGVVARLGSKNVTVCNTLNEELENKCAVEVPLQLVLASAVENALLKDQVGAAVDEGSVKANCEHLLI
jgi:hypothetical protein